MKKITKKDKRRLILVSVCLIFLVCSFTRSVYKDWKQILSNKREASELEEKYQALLKEEQALESEVNKLQDEEYVARYAREKFLLSKAGEIIIWISSDENKN